MPRRSCCAVAAQFCGEFWQRSGAVERDDLHAAQIDSEKFLDGRNINGLSAKERNVVMQTQMLGQNKRQLLAATHRLHMQIVNADVPFHPADCTCDLLSAQRGNWIDGGGASRRQK